MLLHVTVGHPSPTFTLAPVNPGESPGELHDVSWPIWVLAEKTGSIVVANIVTMPLVPHERP